MKMRQVNPKLLMLYIGEGYGAACADDDFFENIIYVDDSTFEDAVQNYKQAFGIHDLPMLVK